MVADSFVLLAGLVFLLGGGEALVRGATAIATATGVPPLVIGLTIVAFGTSAPELAVNVFAAWQDTGGLSFGNIFGSNMANIGLILGICGLIMPLKIQSVVVFREIPMMMVATAAAVAMAIDWTSGQVSARFDRGDGLLLLLLRKQQGHLSVPRQHPPQDGPKRPKPQAPAPQDGQRHPVHAGVSGDNTS